MCIMCSGYYHPQYPLSFLYHLHHPSFFPTSHFPRFGFVTCLSWSFYCYDKTLKTLRPETTWDGNSSLAKGSLSRNSRQEGKGCAMEARPENGGLDSDSLVGDRVKAKEVEIDRNVKSQEWKARGSWAGSFCPGEHAPSITGHDQTQG